MSRPEIISLRCLSQSRAQTAAYGADLARRLKRPLLVELTGDLGSGKTAFVKGLVKALDGPQATSPSFTIENFYPTASGPVFHFDFYRLNQAGVTGPLLLEAMAEPRGLVLVEWPGLVRQLLSQPRLVIEFSFGSGPQDRQLDYLIPDQLTYLKPEMLTV